DVLAQDNSAAFQLDLQDRALGQAQRIAHRLGQSDLAAFGNGGFHGCLQGAYLHAAIIHTFSCILESAYRARRRYAAWPVTEAEPEVRTLAGTLRANALQPQEAPPWPIP